MITSITNQYKTKKGTKFLGEGEYGICYLLDDDNGIKKVIKLNKHKDNPNIPFMDGDVLERLQKHSDSFGRIFEKTEDYIIKEYFEGHSLKTLGYDNDKNHISELPLYLLKQLKEHIDFALQSGVYPNDINYSNIMISSDQKSLRIIDVGNWRFFNENFKDFMVEKLKKESLYQLLEDLTQTKDLAAI